MKKAQVKTSSDLNTSDLQLKGFKVYEIESGMNAVPSYNRRDFYKICINTGHNIVHYADRSFESTETLLFFGNPYVPYSWEMVSSIYTGYACVFTEEFFKSAERSDSLQQSNLFKIGGNPIFVITEEQKEFISALFRKMLVEQATDYAFKADLIRNYMNLIIHEALKMQPQESFFKQQGASARISNLFMDLLERQFPIESPEHPLQFKTPKDFADNLSVHVNHLNRSVKEMTGKPTNTIIGERIISEAKALLQHTDLSVAEIGYALGFEYPTYFNNFFKRKTGITPKTIRN